MTSTSTLEYLATVAFYLNGVPHHAAGTWQTSKKLAQRDAADKALAFFAGRRGVDASEDDGRTYEERLLEDFCARLPACGGQVRWNIWPEDCNNAICNEEGLGRCFAVVELELLGVPHRLAGAVRESESEAILDVTRRALWYLQCPGFEDEFEPEKLISHKGLPCRSLEQVQEISKPPNGWTRDDSSEEACEEAERKTIVMRVQNRLQQQFARQMRPGQRVWEWNYVKDHDDEEWPPFFCARVVVPVIGKEFVGEWVRGKRDAQIDAVARVSQYLDELCCFEQKKPRGKGRRRLNHREFSASSTARGSDAVLFVF